jgi:ATP-binding cassette subfamily C (CFTR/MRP) protein 1
VNGLLRKYKTTVLMASSSGIYHFVSLLLFTILITLQRNVYLMQTMLLPVGGDGKISEQGSFRDLNAEGGYVSSFSLAPPEWIYEPKDTIKLLQGKESGVIDPIRNTEDDASRRTGDVAIYLYYIRAVGWIPSLIFVLAISAFVFCLSFPSKICQYSFAAGLLTCL